MSVNAQNVSKIEIFFQKKPLTVFVTSSLNQFNRVIAYIQSWM